MPNQPAPDFWPAPLRHCALPLVTAVDEHVTIGEISSEPIDGFSGNRMLYTAMVPTEHVESILKAVGGIGHGVFSETRHQAFGSEGDYSPPFWISGPDGSQRFETLVHTWDNHNKIVLLPDSALLERFQLIPRVTKDGCISWDDPRGPVYDVVRVIPLSKYSIETGYTPARITVRRDYFEDYLSQKGCAAVATYFDERFSSNDPEVAALIVSYGSEFQQPGRELWFKSIDLDFANQISQVWACGLLLAPTGRPISDPPEL